MSDREPSPFWGDYRRPSRTPIPRYDIRNEVAAIEARIRTRSLGGVTINANDERWLNEVGITWEDE